MTKALNGEEAGATPIELARTALFRGDLASAKEHLHHAMLGETTSDIAHLLADIAMEEGRLSDARRHLEDALTRDGGLAPEVVANLRAISELLRLNGDRPIACRPSQSPPLSALPLDIVLGVPVVPCSIQGRDIVAVLDTGASEVIVSEDLAGELPISVRVEGGIALGSGGAAPAAYGILDEVSLGALRIQRVIAGIVTLPAELSTRGVRAVVSPGALLKRERLIIDHPHRLVIVGLGAPDEDAVPFLSGNHLVLAPVSAGGGPSRPFLIDTGAGHSFVLPAYGEIPGSEEVEGIAVATGVGGASSVGSRAAGVRLRIGDHETGDLIVFRQGPLDVSSISRLLGTTFYGIVGQDAFEGAVLEIDYAARRVRVRRP